MDSLKSGSAITDVFTQGKRYHSSYLTLIVLPSRDRSCSQSGRVAFIAGKKYGNAIWRNSAKRRMRAICREILAQRNCPWPGYDVVFLAKQSILSGAYQVVLAETRSALLKAFPHLSEDLEG